MMQAIQLDDARLTRTEQYILRQIALRISGGVFIPSQTYVTKAEKLFSTNRDVDEPEGEGQCKSLAPLT